MPDHVRVTAASVPPDLARHVEAVCRAFEAACSAGGEPRIEEFLLNAPATARAVLLRELLRLELAYRAGRPTGNLQFCPRQTSTSCRLQSAAQQATQCA